MQLTQKDAPNGKGGNEFSTDLQQLMLLQREYAVSAVRKTQSSPLRFIRAGSSRLLEGVAKLLERRSSLAIAGSLCVALAGFLVFMTQEGKQESATPAPAFNDTGETPATPRDAVAAAPILDQVANRDARPPARKTGGESFTVVVGSFRDPSNANRVATSLQERMLQTHMELANGLYVVTVGPISQRFEAENLARFVRESVGLVPEILTDKLH